jgi:hypothetical protein
MISSLLYVAIRLAVLAAFTFLFVVLYEHGPADYLKNVQADFLSLVGTQAPE